MMLDDHRIRQRDIAEQERPGVLDLKTSVVDTIRIRRVLFSEESKCVRQSNSRRIFTCPEERARFLPFYVKQIDMTYLMAKESLLNYETGANVCSQCIWDNHKSASAVKKKEIAPQIMTPGVGLVFLDRRQFGFRRSPDEHTAITGNKAELACIKKHYRYPLRPNELWLDTTSVANGNGLELAAYTLQGMYSTHIYS
ncbi:hypothetical protein TNCV_4777991 [Trichonephila clavipes]|nr:hypothetical protein TNCV_4777991 [Trichonephila clavipes]